MPPKDKDKTVSAADVAPLAGVAAPAPPAARPKPFLSEGMRDDLQNNGWAIDPVSGARYELDRESGEVTVTEKGALDPATGEASAGEVSTVDVDVTPPATVTDPRTGRTTVTDPDTGAVTVTDADGNIVSE